MIIFIISEEDLKRLPGFLVHALGVSDADLAVLSGLESDVRIEWKCSYWYSH